MKETLNRVISGLAKSNPEWAPVISRWSGFLEKAARSISVNTGVDPEDALGDILESVTFVLDLYKGSLFKHNKRLYRVLESDGSISKISAIRATTRKKEGTLSVPSDSLVQVTLGKMDTVLYRCVYQQYVNILSCNFTQANGYEPDGSSAKSGRVSKVKVCQHLELSQLSQEDISSYMFDNSSDPEEFVIVMDVISSMEKSLGSRDFEVLDQLINDHTMTLHELSDVVGVSYGTIYNIKGRIRSSFMEILKG
jgi:hypothetical protein